jgi:flagellar protein FlaJ
MIGGMKSRLGKSLRRAAIIEKPHQYIGKAVKFSLVAAIIFWFLWSIFNGTFIEGLLGTVLFFFLCISASMIYPKYVAKKRASLVEKDLPFVMLGLSLHTKARLTTEKGIEKIAKGGYGIISMEFRKVLDEVRGRGSSLQESLLGMSERFESRALKRGIMQILSSHENGNRRIGAAGLKRIGRDELSRQRSESREFSGKIALLSLMFIAVSAIVPALFQSFMIVGSTFMRIDFTPLQIIAITTIILPAFDVGILLYIRSITPEFLK